jgi:hypothetical protein
MFYDDLADYVYWAGALARNLMVYRHQTLVLEATTKKQAAIS